MDYNNLVQEARVAQKKALAKYSNFRVGAALLTDDDQIIHGANIENASYGLTVCAERTALFTALLDDKKNFKAIAIIGDTKGFCPPCGACRQVMLEHCPPDFEVVLANAEDEIKVYKLKELIPHSFDDTHL